MNKEKRIGEKGTAEKRCKKCGEWKPKNEEYFYKSKASGKFRDECKDCTAPFQKYRVKSNKKKKASKAKEKSSHQKSKEIKKIKKSNVETKRHTYKMNADTIEKIDILSNVSGLDKGEIITNAVNYFIDHNEKYELMISQYKKLIKRFRD